MPRRLLLDYDGRMPGGFLRRVSWVLRVAANTRPILVRVDRTENGFHAVVVMSRNISHIRVVLLQSLLGSDWRRETFNARRVARIPYVGPEWRDRVNVLYFRHHRSVRV